MVAMLAYSFFTLFISCFVLDAREEEEEEAESGEATLISVVVKMIMCPTCQNQDLVILTQFPYLGDMSNRKVHFQHVGL